MSERKYGRKVFYAAILVVILIAALTIGVWKFWFQKRVEVIELRILTMDLPFGRALITTIAKEYQKINPNIRVTGELVPYDTLHEKVMTELAAGSPTYDIITTDCIWAGEVVGNRWVYCLDDMRSEDPSLPPIHYENLLEASLVYVTYDGKRWGLPAGLNTQALVYRVDLFEKYGVKVPRNWDEFLEAAKKLTLDLDGDGKIDVYGTTLVMGAQDPGYSDWTFRLFGYGPIKEGQREGFIFTDDAKPAFNRPEAIKAIERLKEILPYCPPGCLGFDYPDAASLYYEGKLAMLVHWTDTFVDAENPAVSKVVGKNGYTRIPADVVNYQSVGYYQLWINKASKHPKEAYKFFAWMSEGKAYHLMYEAGENALVYKKDVQDPEIRKKVPFLKVWDEIEHTVPIPVWYPEFTEVQRIIWEEVSLALADKKTSAQAIEDAYNRVYELMRSHGYY